MIDDDDPQGEFDFDRDDDNNGDPTFDPAFGPAFARNTDPGTSHEAASSMQGEPSTRLQKMILRALTIHHPNTLICSELVALLDEQWNTVSPRLKPLRSKGYIHDSGVRRPGPSGRRQIAWGLGPGGANQQTQRTPVAIT